ncbi:MAG TPA: hypothetical protein PKN48_10025 [Bacteroidales bacterium]|nr:hypothetical protein [Bacteroidales bacterium]
MAAQLNFITSGKMVISLEGMQFGRQIKDPQKNVKHFGLHQTALELESADQGNFTEWGSIEIIDLKPEVGTITITVDCDKWLFFGTAQFELMINGHIILIDNFQSGIRGPVGDPKKKKQYAIGNF